MDPIIASDVASYLDSEPPRINSNRLMVLGASGMLGSYVVEFVCELAHLTGDASQIVAVSRSDSAYLHALKSQYKDLLQIVGYEDVPAILATSDGWLVVHAASPASPDQYLGHESGLIDTNIQLTIDVMNALSQKDGQMIYFSSGEVYGPSPELPTREDSYSAFDHLGPRGCYGEAKRAGELIVKVMSDESSVRAAALRIYHTFGPGIDLNQSRIFSTVVKSLHEKTPILLRTTGDARRSFLYSADLVSAILHTATRDGFSAYNVAGETEMSVKEFAEVASRWSGGSSPVIVMSGHLSQSEAMGTESPILRGIADTRRLKSLGWRPLVSVEEAIIRTVQSVQWRSNNGF